MLCFWGAAQWSRTLTLTLALALNLTLTLALALALALTLTLTLTLSRSRTQLLGELARGHWGLCKASVAELISPPQERRAGLVGRLVYSPA